MLMKKKLSLLMVALVAVAAFAFQQTRRTTVEKSYTITFHEWTGHTDGDNSSQVTDIASLIAEGADYVESFEKSNVYQAREGRGIKLGTGSKTGSLKLVLKDKIKPTKIVVSARGYSASEKTFKLFDDEYANLGTDFADITKTFDGETEVSEITFATTSKRAYVKTVTVYYNEEEEPATINTMAIVGDLTGGWPNDEDWSMAKAMTQSTENSAIWTLTVEGFEAEAKKYEYKATANGKWGDYELPSSGNQDFTFEAAGKYNLTFTADTENHTLTLDVQKVEEPQGLIPDGTYYVMNADAGTLVTAAGALDAKGAPISFTYNGETYTIAGADFFAEKQWTIAEAVEGMSGYYYISTEVEGQKAYLSVAENALTPVTTPDENCVWIVLQQSYWEDIVNSTYTVAGTKNLTGTENDWDIVEANKMTYNEETKLFEMTYKKITVNNDTKPEFKVVKQPMEGAAVWYPEGDNWVITPDVVGGEGIFDITITFDPSDLKEIKVSALQYADIEISPAEGDIAAALAEASAGKIAENITINLAANGAYTISAPIVPSAGFVINGNGATIDASGLNDAFIKMDKNPNVEKVESGQYVVKTASKIDGVKITGLTKGLYADNGTAYTFENFTINNSVFQYKTQSTIVLNFASSMAINFNITNSTFFSLEAGSANFIALSGKRPWQITGYADVDGKLTVDHNTFYNVAKAKQFLNTNTLKGQNKYKYEMNSNIFVDVSNKKIYGNMTNNTTMVMKVCKQILASRMPQMATSLSVQALLRLRRRLVTRAGLFLSSTSSVI